MIGDHKSMNVQRDFMKYTGQRILDRLKENAPLAAEGLRVDASDRKYQVWERNSLGIPLTEEKVFVTEAELYTQQSGKGRLMRIP